MEKFTCHFLLDSNVMYAQNLPNYFQSNSVDHFVAKSLLSFFISLTVYYRCNFVVLTLYMRINVEKYYKYIRIFVSLQNFLGKTI